MSTSGVTSSAKMGSGNYWEGTLVRLRGIEPEDADTFHAWNADSEMARQVDYVWPPSSLAATRAWAQRMATQEPKDDALWCAIETVTGELVGSLNTHSANRHAGTFSYGIALGAEYRGRGFATEALPMVLRYYFEELRYQKVTAVIYSFNAVSIGLHEKLGFQLEGRVRRMIYTGGQYHDKLFYGMTREEFAARLGT